MVGLSATTSDGRLAGELFAVAALRQDLFTAHGCDVAGPVNEDTAARAWYEAGMPTAGEA
jgi:hypothetical protein